LATGPAWNTWAGTVVPERIRARYFSFRSRVAQACVFAGFLSAGIALQIGRANGRTLQTFAVLFLAAGCCRFCSSRLLAGQSEPVLPDRSKRPASVWQQLARLRGRQDGRLLAYLVSMQTAVYISAPFFNPYLLRQLELGYGSYVGLVAASYLAKALAMPLLGKLAHRAGARRLLWIGGVGIVPLAAMWNISNDYGFMMFLQVIGGAAWASYELGMFLMFFERIHAEERTGVLTIYNVGNALATVVGGFCGAGVLWQLGESRDAYLFLFALSSWARAGTLVLLSRIPTVVTGTVTPAIRTLSVTPTTSGDTPILASLDDDEVDASAV
jgi:MFS family permease